MKSAILIITVSIVCIAISGCFNPSVPGYTVNEVLPKSTFEKLGIKKGDRIISYDGEEVNSVGDSMELYDKLKKNSVKTILIERDGKKQTLTVP